MTLDQQISILEKEQSQKEQYLLQREKIVTHIANQEKDLLQHTEQLQEKQTKSIQLQTELEQKDVSKLLDLEAINRKLSQSFYSLEDLINDYQKIKINIKQLQEEEKMINNLYQIFSKELLLIVLEDNLPVLSEVINNFLSQVVDYQINFFLSKSITDKLELEAHIYDDKGERDVKSLS